MRKAKNKVTVRMCGFALNYIFEMKKFFEDNLSETLCACVDICIDASKKNNFIFEDAWYESPKRHKRVDIGLEYDRRDHTLQVTTFLNDEQFEFMTKFLDKKRYPQFRGTRVNVLSMCVYYAVREIMRGHVDRMKLVWVEPQSKLVWIDEPLNEEGTR